MFLFIFESLGTSELILIGIVALIFLGPRRLPEIARKVGKVMADFRNTTSEFKQTWEREVNFEEETKALRTGDLEETTPRITPPSSAYTEGVSAPEVKEIDASAFNAANAESLNESNSGLNGDERADDSENGLADSTLADKKNWL